MVSRILIVGQSTPETMELKSKLIGYKRYGVKLCNTVSEAVSHLTAQSYNLVIFNLDFFTKKKINVATNLRRAGYGFPVLVVANSVTPEALHKMDEITRTVIVERPYEDKHVFGVINKLINGRDVPQRIHRRYHTKQNTFIEPFGDSGHIQGQMMNLSMGGAHINLTEDKQSNLEVGRIVRMNVSLEQMEKMYQVSARVIWKGQSKGIKTGKSIGVEFINTDDVYKNLLGF